MNKRTESTESRQFLPFIYLSCKISIRYTFADFFDHAVTTAVSFGVVPCISAAVFLTAFSISPISKSSSSAFCSREVLNQFMRNY